MNLKHYTLLLLALLMGSLSAVADGTHYTPIASGTYPNTMNIVAVVKSSGEIIKNVELAAFAGEECRGTMICNEAGLIYLNVRGAGDAALVFKIWDGTQEYTVDQGISFRADAIHGSVAAPYEVTLPTGSIAITLDESAEDNSFVAGSGVDVQLRRTLSTEYWNTFCVPFNISAEQISATFGEGTEVLEFQSATADVVSFATVSSISAGVPCLILPTSEVVDPLFEGVDIIDAAAEVAVGTSTDAYHFIGTYCSTLLKTNKSEIFINKQNLLAYPFINGNKLLGLRAFLRKNAEVSGESSRLATLQFGSTTGIEAIDNGELIMDNDAPLYDLSGRRVLSPAKGGIYVKNGKKCVK